MKGKYKHFYLTMCAGTILLAGMFYGAEFEMLTLKWFMSFVFTILPMILFALYLQEAYKTYYRDKVSLEGKQ